MRLMLPACLAFLLLTSAGVRAQVSSRSHLHDGPQLVANDEKIREVMQRAETHYRLGELSLKDGKHGPAREEFNKAVDTVLEAGFDLRATPGLQKYYLGLVERIYKLETTIRDASQPQTQEKKPAPPAVGFVEQKFEPSPLDELNKIILTKDELEVTAPKPCNADGDAKLELRGFQIGMSVAEVKRRLPSLKPSPPNNYGVSAAAVVLGALERRDPLLKDVRGANFALLDGRVSGVTVFYNDAAGWESAGQFSAQVAEAMNLTSDWLPMRTAALGTLYVMRCEGVSVVAGLSRMGGARFPVISLRDERAMTTIMGRIKDEELKKQKAAEERRRSFKP